MATPVAFPIDGAAGVAPVALRPGYWSLDSAGRNQLTKTLREPEPDVHVGRHIKLVNPYQTKSNVYKGQLHCHSNVLEGAQSPEELVADYRDAGYDFVSITDHSEAGQEIITVPAPVVSGILFIPGIEDTLGAGHLNRINADGATVNSAQGCIDLGTANGSIVFLNHPNYAPAAWSDAELEGLSDYHGLEVYNGGTGVIDEDDVDHLLARYRRIWLFAADDCHDTDGAAFNVGWVMVYADTCTLTSIMAALKAGNFYSSIGAVFSSISVSGLTITVTTNTASTIEFIGVVNGVEGSALQTATLNATTASYTVTGSEVYVRIKLTRDDNTRMAWSNPIYVTQPQELAKGGAIRGDIYQTGNLIQTGNITQTGQTTITSSANPSLKLSDSGLDHLRMAERFTLSGSVNFHLINNAYCYAGTSFKYLAAAAASELRLASDGSFAYASAPVGVIDGTVTFTDRFKVTPLGRVWIPSGLAPDAGVVGESALYASSASGKSELFCYNENGIATQLTRAAALTGVLQANGASADSVITGTAGYIPSWSAAAPYLSTTSPLYSDGSNLGLGTTTTTGSGTAGTTALWIGNGTPPAGGRANQAALYSADVGGSAKLHMLEESGTTYKVLGVDPTTGGCSINSSDLNHLLVGNRFGLTGSTNFYLSNNVTTVFPDDKYITTAAAARIKIGSDGAFTFQNAPSGTGGDVITFTDRLVMLPGGNLGLGTTIPGGATVGTYVFSIANGTVPVGGVVNQVSFFAQDVNGTSEFCVLDEGGAVRALTQSAIVTNTPAAGAVTITVANGVDQSLAMNGAGNVTATLTAPSGPGALRLKVIGGATPGAVTSWLSSSGLVKFPDAEPWTDPAANKHKFVTFVWDGTNFHGVHSGDFTT